MTSGTPCRPRVSEERRKVTHQLLRDGPAMGLVALVTGDRTLLTARVSALLPQLWSLRMVDPADLLMAGLSRARSRTVCRQAGWCGCPTVRWDRWR